MAGRNRILLFNMLLYISWWKAHINTWWLNWKVSTITDVFLDQKRVNVCEHMVKTAHMVPSSHTFTLLNKKDIVIVKTFQFIRSSLHFFSKSFLFLFPKLCYPYFSTFLSTWCVTSVRSKYINVLYKLSFGGLFMIC
jgi:hypothetical protein